MDFDLPGALEALGALLQGRLETGDASRELHGRDESWHPPHAPDAVCFPETTEEVSRIAKVCGYASLRMYSSDG